MTIFDILKSISQTKVDLSTQDDFEKEYNSFMINRFLTMQIDTAYFAKITDSMPTIPKKLQYQILLKLITKKPRYFKYEKKCKDTEDLTLVKKYFNCSNSEAQVFSQFLTKDDFKEIKRLFNG